MWELRNRGIALPAGFVIWVETGGAVENSGTVVTLCEGEFLFGAAALANSLQCCGFTGEFLVGLRESGLNAPLLEALFSKDARRRLKFKLVLEGVDTAMHFTNYKAKVLTSKLSGDPLCSRAFYLDPDITVLCPWDFVSMWVDAGVALCADVNWCMPSDHPIRSQWKAMLWDFGHPVARSPHLYYNGGFIGIHRRDAEFAALWDALIDRYGGETNPLDAQGDIAEWRKGGRWNRVFSPNQDTLNMAAMAWPKAIATLGPDAMGFVPGDTWFPHAIGSRKPWRKRYLVEALRGFPPTTADKAFWRFCEGPIPVFPWRTIRLRRLQIKVASMVGRIYKRG